MKRTLLLTCLICSALVLSACASNPSGGSAENSFAANGSSSFRRQSGLAGILSIFTGGSRSFTLTAEEKLAFGTLKLDSNGKTIDRTEAEKLLPLWQLLHQLYSSSSAASEEKAAVVDAIRATMTPDQVAAIDNMQIGRADLFTAFQQGQSSSSNTGTSGTGAARTQGSTGNSTRRNGGGGQAFFFEGPAGGFGAFRQGSATGNGTGSTTTTTTQQSINSAERAQAAANNLTNALIEEVIHLLQGQLSG